MKYAIVEYPIKEDLLKSGLIAQTNETAKVNNFKNKCVVSYNDSYNNLFRGYPTLPEEDLIIYFSKNPEEWDDHYIENNKTVVVETSPPFTSKFIEVGGVVKSLFKRVHGVSEIVPAGATRAITFTVPYIKCKFSGAEIIGCRLKDTVDFLVQDTDNNDISGIPIELYGANLPLNQFGFSVQMPNGSYSNTSSYDADLLGGMVLTCIYTNNNITDTYIAVNLELHEVK